MKIMIGLCSMGRFILYSTRRAGHLVLAIHLRQFGGALSSPRHVSVEAMRSENVFRGPTRRSCALTLYQMAAITTFGVSHSFSSSNDELDYRESPVCGTVAPKVCHQISFCDLSHPCGSRSYIRLPLLPQSHLNLSRKQCIDWHIVQRIIPVREPFIVMGWVKGTSLGN
jgi:hypothetical protein